MKMKRLFTTLVSLLVIFAIAGCSNGNGSGQAAAASNGSGQAANGFAKPDVYGEVAKIDGNQVTLKLMEIPQRNGRNGNNRRNWQNGQNGQNWQNNGQNNGNVAAGGGNGAGGPGGMRARRYTGEEKTIVIPNGVSIVTMTRGTNGMTEDQMALKDITVGSILSVYYKTDGKTIDKIRVMKPRAFGGQGVNTNANANTNTNTNSTTTN
jgi:hypothetical protein